MNKRSVLHILLLSLFFVQKVCAIPFFSSTPLEKLKSGVSHYDIEKFREVLKHHYHFHSVNNTLNFDVDTALLRKCEHKTMDTARLYEMVHDFQELKKTVKETREKSRTEYFLKGAGSAATGIILGVFAIVAALKTSDKWEAIEQKNEETIHLGIVGVPGVASLPALYYAYTTGQLGKAWNYEENRTKLSAIEQEIQQVAKIIHDRAQSSADDETKKVLKNFVEEMNSKGK